MPENYKFHTFKNEPPDPPPHSKNNFPPELVGGLCAMAPVLGLAWLVRRKRRRLARGKRAALLERVLLHFTPNDPLTVRQLLNSVIILGRTGSGKTTSSGRQLARAVLRVPHSGGLILAAKPGEDLELWRELFRAVGREDDLLVFEPGGELRFNFLDHVLKTGGDTREITRCLTVIGETLRSGDTKGGENSDFWEVQNGRMLAGAVEVVKLATGRVDSWDLQRFINGAAQSVDQLKDPAWLGGYHCELLLDAENAPKSGTAAHDFDRAKEYWLGELPALSDRTRSSITTGALGLLDVFNTGAVRELVGTTTNVSPDDTLAHGKWVLVNVPPAEYGDLGNFVGAGWKYLMQRAVLKRVARDTDPVHLIWCDEFQQAVNSYDAHYLAQCRSHRGCLVALTQSVHGLFAALKGRAGEHQTEMLLTNFHHKILHALGDSRTAEWASKLIGKCRQTFIGGSTAPSAGVFDGLLGRGNFTGSFSEQVADIVEPRAFINGLRTGGPENGLMCDAIIVRSGEPFSTDGNWLPVAFSQK